MLRVERRFKSKRPCRRAAVAEAPAYKVEGSCRSYGTAYAVAVAGRTYMSMHHAANAI